mgnify:CR=1 FL=1
MISGILISNQVKRKRVFFLSGHEERDIYNIDRSSDSLGQAKITLERDNYDVSSITTDELSRIILNFSLSNELDLFPSAIIISDPLDEILDSEKNVIREYILLGGNLMLLLEPDSPKGYVEMISGWGIVSGEGTLIDRISYVAPNLEFLQIKDSNLHKDICNKAIEHIHKYYSINNLQNNLVNYFDENIPISGKEGIYWSHQLATKEGIITGVSGGSTFAVAMKVAEDAPDGANILCMLADTAERYLSSVLFDEIDSEMNDEENDLLNSI